MFLSLCPCVPIVRHLPVSENMQCLVFCSYISFLRMMVSRLIHVPTKDTNSSFFDGCIVFHGVYLPHFLYPVYLWWAFVLVPSLCYCKQCCSKHRCSCVFVIQCFMIVWVCTQSWDCGSNGIYVSRSLRCRHTVFRNVPDYILL